MENHTRVYITWSKIVVWTALERYVGHPIYFQLDFGSIFCTGEIITTIYYFSLNISTKHKHVRSHLRCPVVTMAINTSYLNYRQQRISTGDMYEFIVIYALFPRYVLSLFRQKLRKSNEFKLISAILPTLTSARWLVKVNQAFNVS